MVSFSDSDLLSLLKHYSYECCFIESLDGTILYISDSFQRITGQDPADLIGKHSSVLIELGLIDQTATNTNRLNDQSWSTIVSYKNGKDSLTTLSPCHDSNGNLIAYIGNMRDITEYSYLQDQLNNKDDNLRYLENMLQSLSDRSFSQDGIIMESPPMKLLAGLAERLAKVDSTILITGESGVGKDVYAQLIQRLSQKNTETPKPFVKISCGAIPESLLESELFGYEYGAFTGAKKGGKPGAFELAKDGMIFLDEIGEMPLALQVKLLTVLQDREFTRLGGTKPQKLRARLVAATNQDLQKLVDEKKFRGDLYYRLNVLPIQIPPLRERTEDIVPLIQLFSDNVNQKYEMNKSFSLKAVDLLISYNWPGNIRELSNIVERAFIFCPEDIISEQFLPESVTGSVSALESEANESEMSLTDYVNRAEKRRIQSALTRAHSLKEAAAELQIDVSTLTRKMRKHNFPYKDQQPYIIM